MFEWAYSLKRVASDLLRSLMVPGFTLELTPKLNADGLALITF